eukprot:scaffold66773_cov18-Tisochrysis_lutea.AAC.3
MFGCSSGKFCYSLMALSGAEGLSASGKRLAEPLRASPPTWLFFRGIAQPYAKDASVEDAFVDLPVIRRNGMDGMVTVDYATQDGTGPAAVAGYVACKRAYFFCVIQCNTYEKAEPRISFVLPWKAPFCCLAKGSETVHRLFPSAARLPVYNRNCMRGMVASVPGISLAWLPVLAPTGQHYKETKGTLVLESGEDRAKIRIPLLAAGVLGKLCVCMHARLTSKRAVLRLAPLCLLPVRTSLLQRLFIHTPQKLSRLSIVCAQACSNVPCVPCLLECVTSCGWCEMLLLVLVTDAGVTGAGGACDKLWVG